MSDIITENKALEIVNEFISEITSLDSDGILAVFLIGSLGGGYYRPGQSDIDTAIILRDNARITQKQIEGIADKYFTKYRIPKGFGAEVIFERDFFPPYQKSVDQEDEFTVEIARLKIQGKIVYGSFDMSSIPMPSREYFIRDAIIFISWLVGAYGSDAAAELDITSCVNTILMHLRRYLMIEKGAFEFNKFRIISEYLKNEPPVVENDIFDFIMCYLNGNAVQPDSFTDDLRRFTQHVAEYFTKTLLGM